MTEKQTPADELAAEPLHADKTTGLGLPEASEADTMLEALTASMPDAVEPMDALDLGEYELVQNVGPSRERGETDVDGVQFDPDMHRVDSDGNPVKTKAGRWAKRPGNKKGNNGSASKVGKTDAQKEAARKSDPDALAREACRLHGHSAAAMTYGGGRVFFGKDGGPDYEHAPDGEFEGMAASWEAYFWHRYVQTGQMPETDPRLMIATSVLAYASVRMVHSKPVQTRMEKIKDVVLRRVAVPVINWIKSRKAKRATPKAPNGEKA